MDRSGSARPAGASSRWRRAAQCGAAALLILPTPAGAQQAGFGVRAGVVFSTPIAEDRVANPRLAAALGGGIGPVRAVPGAALQLEAEASLAMRSRTMLDLAIGWTAAGIDAEDDAGRRDLQDAGVGHALVSVRYLATPLLHGGCGFGVIRYFAEARALFAAGSEISPLLECGARVRMARVAGRGIIVRVAGQMHRFRTPVLADAGARMGTVARLAIQAGFDLRRDR